MAKIIFVYNANSGAMNSLMDLVHKAVSPSTYQCNLCAVTYDAFGVRSEWKSFVDQLPCAVEFLHKDELEERYGITDIALPAAFVESEAGELETWIRAETINGLTSVDELKSLVKRKLATAAWSPDHL